MRYLEGKALPLCRSQLAKLLACAICLNARYWDDGAHGEVQFLRMFEATGISLDDFAAMEITMLSTLGWRLGMREGEFELWAKVVDGDGVSCVEAGGNGLERAMQLLGGGKDKSSTLGSPSHRSLVGGAELDASNGVDSRSRRRAGEAVVGGQSETAEQAQTQAEGQENETRGTFGVPVQGIGLFGGLQLQTQDLDVEEGGLWWSEMVQQAADGGMGGGWGLDMLVVAEGGDILTEFGPSGPMADEEEMSQVVARESVTVAVFAS